jgi:amidophosphoribosyltransferase
LHLISRSRENTIIDALIDSLRKVKGAYSIVFLTENSIVGARDPNGFRPLCLGKLDNSYIFASETCAFDIVGANYVRDVEPGEIIVINRDGVKSIKPFEKTANRLCIFEYIYFSKPDSYVDGMSVYKVRKKMGEILAEEAGVEAEMVIPVPDSSNVAAIGYSQRSGIPFEFGSIRSHYKGRTIIKPSQRIRDFGTKLKFNTTRGLMVDKDVVVVDDSIVRGTTSGKIVGMLRRAGARKVHVRIASPPIKYPCFYGIDTPTRNELIASSNDIENIRREINADSLAYLSIEGLLEPVKQGEVKYCTACFEGNYPLDIPDDISKTAFEKVYPRKRLL